MKTRVGILFGGRSGEHDVSCVSARHVAAALDADRYTAVPIGITRTGLWVLPACSQAALSGGRLEIPEGRFVAEGAPLGIFGGFSGEAAGQTPDLGLDVVFPVLHGPFGEDGTVQGMLELTDCPYVGSGVLGSAVGMDKALMKTVFTAAGIPQADYLVIRRRDWDLRRGDCVERACALGFPAFTKPANLGSSVGISRCADRAELEAGIAEAFGYDRKVVVEENIAGREIECAVLGNDQPEASVCGEIVAARAFYDYEAKYSDSASQTIAPAELPESVSETIRALSLKGFEAVEAAGLARVDFFYEEPGRGVLINEINTMPGFTEISMFPKLWAKSGLSYPELLDRLIALAFERYSWRTG
ncbi:MAG: D-alanine--D-alanine ligase family protein [Actinomycetota bacterium]